MLRTLVKSIYYFCIPKNRFGDRIVSFARFVQVHNRLPTNKRTLNDLLYRTKTSDEILDPIRVFTSDKELVKLYVKAVVGECYTVRTFGIIREKRELLSFEFPDRCVIKPTHAAGLVIIKTSDAPVDIKLLSSWLKLNYYDVTREANYRYLKPKIIVEELVFDRANVDDIKFFCVHGEVRLIQWDFDRHANHTRRFFDREWSDLNVSMNYPLSSKTIDKPKNLNAMIDVAEKLSVSLEFVRIDMYIDLESGRFYVGEMTHCHAGANGVFYSQESEKLVSKTLFCKPK